MSDRVDLKEGKDLAEGSMFKFIAHRPFAHVSSKKCLLALSQLRRFHVITLNKVSGWCVHGLFGSGRENVKVLA